MPNILAYMQRKSIFTTLFLSILLLAGLSVISSTTGWYLLEVIRESQQRLSVKTLPLISAAQSMANESSSLALLAPQISRSETELGLDKLYIELGSHLDIMEKVQNRIEGGVTRQTDTHVIRATVADISANFDSLRILMSAKFAFQQLINIEVEEAIVKIDDIDYLIDHKISALSDEAFHLTNQIRQSGIGDNSQSLEGLINLNADSETLFELNRKTIMIKALLIELKEIDTYFLLKEVKSKIDFQVRLMVSLAVGLSDSKSKRLLSIELSKLYKRLNLKINVAYLQKQLIAQNLELLELDTRVINDVSLLNSLISDVVNQVELNTFSDTSEANSAATLGSNILYAIAIMSLVVSTIVIWFFVIRKVILPLAEVTNMIRQLSGNKLDIEIKSYTMIELNEISQALKVFRDNSLALNEHKNGLIESNFLLTRANDDLNAFVQVASHDLKTPLRGIQVLSDFVVTDIKDGNLDEAQSNVRLLQQRIVRLGHLLNSLLNYTKLEPISGGILQVDMMCVIQEAFNALDDTDHFTLKFPHELPVCHVVEADLIVIFTNLFSNAISHHDHAEGVITVYFRETDDSYVFDVCDDGPGIAEEFQQRIFSILQTLKTKDEVEGSGVGLAYVKRLLETRGGGISIISNPELARGSRFVFHYPKTSAEE